MINIHVHLQKFINNQQYCFMIINQDKVIDFLAETAQQADINILKNNIKLLQKSITNFQSDDLAVLNITINAGETIFFNTQLFQSELIQILESQTLERAHYYTKRLIKSISEVKTSKINDLNLNRWKEYTDIQTDSLWVIEKRDNSGAHNAKYWGNFVPQIPNQFMKRYTKKGEWVLDTFLGSGTTLIEAQRLGRNAIGVELQPKVVALAQQNLQNDMFANGRTEIINADCTTVNYQNELEKIGISSVQMVIMHPPYWDIIKFSDDQRDMSNAATIEDFLQMFGQAVDNVLPILDKGRYLVVVISDKYKGGEWIPLAFYTMQEVQKRGLTLKSTIVKNFEDTKAKANQKELWRYRALVGGFYVFKHEYIFLFKK